MRTFSVAVLALLAAAPPAGVWARGQFRARTTVVLVDVVVRDASGHTVDDLAASDFQVLEDGLARPIVSFERSGVDAAPVGGPGTGRPVGWNAATPPPPQSMIAIVLHHLDPQSRAAAVRAVEPIIATLGRNDFLGIYTLEDDLVELAPFTRDAEVLRAALRKAATTPSTTTTLGAGVAEGDPAPQPGGPGGADAAAMQGRMANGFQVNPYVAGVQTGSLQWLIARLGQFPGRRAVLAYSRGLATPIVLPKLEGVIAAARRQHVSFYNLDAGGLGTASRQPRGPRRLGRSELTSRSGEDVERPVKIAEFDTTGGLGPLAQLTGGAYFSGSNDITAATAAAAADTRRFYLLGYSSSEGVDPDKARIAVRVVRPNLSVRARTRIGRSADGATAGR